MNFASWTFVLLFLPATIFAFHLLEGPKAAEARRAFLIGASIFFYAWAGLVHLAVLVASIVLNFAVGRLLTGFADFGRRLRMAILWTGVAANLALLLNFKLRALMLPDPDGFRAAESILIPLALSFVTFQQIGFITACYRRRVTGFSIPEYLFFVAFFPQLIMGPIVRFQDMAAQLREKSLAQANANDLAIGLSIFLFGLAQKVLLADQLGPHVDRLFAFAQVAPLPPFHAWFAVVAFQFQIYFDFAGYADMAIGLGRMFGIRLPINFDRPLFGSDRFDLWRRWHITYVTFMRTHVFMPLVRHWKFPAWLALAATGMLSGLWHGLGWTFVVWGVIQTIILLAVHFRRRFGFWRTPRGKARRLFAIALTFLITCLIGAMFRSPTLEAGRNVYGALAGLAPAPEAIPPIAPSALLLLVAAAAAGWLMPNSAQLFRLHWNALDLRPEGRPPPRHPLEPRFGFALSRRWAAALAAMLVICLVLIDTSRRFIYVQF
jgi:alginate O-acetyltransferase complex protein AlgI